MNKGIVRIGGYRPRTFKSVENAEKTINRIRRLLNKNGYITIDQKDKEETVMSFMKIDNVTVHKKDITMTVMEAAIYEKRAQ